MFNRQSENINNPSLLYLAVSIEEGLFFIIMEKTITFINWLRDQDYCRLSPKFMDKATKTSKDLFLIKLYRKFMSDIIEGKLITNINIIPENKPKQYQIGIDTFERSESNLSKQEIIAICKFNIDKYCWRKKDQDKDDFKKIIDYANWAIKNL